MVKRILKRLLFVCIAIFIVITFNFFLFRLMPGDIETRLQKSTASQEVKDRIIEESGVNKPWYEQYASYLKSMFSGDLGTAYNSYDGHQRVADIIWSRIPNTVILLVCAEILAILLGMFIGVVCAYKRGRPLDTGLLSASLALYSMPTFWFAMVLIFIFCSGLGWFPASGVKTAGTAYHGMKLVADYLKHMTLPMLCMGLVMVGSYAITMRSTMIDILTEDYITTARAKGFSTRYILFKHAAPNAMLPMSTIIALNLSVVFGGAIQLETLFSWPGLGMLMYKALNARDYPVLQGCFLISTVAIILANFLMDILYGFIDPRVKD